jgi:hypothetical protein
MDFAKFETKFQELDNGKRFASPALDDNAFDSAGESLAYYIYAQERIFSNAAPAEAQRVVERGMKTHPHNYK